MSLFDSGAFDGGGASWTMRDALDVEIGGDVVDCDALTGAAAIAAYGYWLSRRAGRRLPSRADLAPEDMLSFLPRIMLIDVIREPFDLVFRVFGTGVVAAYGRDLTGRSVRDIMPPALGDLAWRQYLEVLAAGRPMAHRVFFSQSHSFRNYTRLTLPLSADGVTIDKLMAIYEGGPAGNEWTI